MKILMTNIRAVAGGEELEAELVISSGEEKMQQIKGRVSFSLYMETELPTVLSEPVEIDRARCEYLMFLMQKTSAIKKGIVFLEYAKNTRKSLKMKLLRKGFSAEVAEEAVVFLAEKGYLREQDDAVQLVETLAIRKLYGKNRIKKELFAKGYDGDTIALALGESDADFAQICAKRILKTGGKALFFEPEMKRKTTAALLRYGFSYDDIREALDIIDETNE